MQVNNARIVNELSFEIAGNFNVSDMHVDEAKIYILNKSGKQAGLCLCDLSVKEPTIQLVNENVTALAVNDRRLFAATKTGEIGSIDCPAEFHIPFTNVTAAAIDILKVWEANAYFRTTANPEALHHINCFKQNTPQIWMTEDRSTGPITCLEASEDFLFVACKVSEIYILNRAAFKQILVLNMPNYQFSPFTSLIYSDGSLAVKNAMEQIWITTIRKGKGVLVSFKSNLITTGNPPTYLHFYKKLLVIASPVDKDKERITFNDIRTNTNEIIPITKPINHIHLTEGHLYLCEEDGNMMIFKCKLPSSTQIPLNDPPRDTPSDKGKCCTIC